MAKKSSQKHSAPAAAPAAAPPAPSLVAGSVVLTVARLNANREVCPAGTVISPTVDGWPEHRVQRELLHGHAVQR